MNSGSTPDPATLRQLQASLAEGIAAGGPVLSYGQNYGGVASPDSNTSDPGRGPNKRPRNDNSLVGRAIAHSVSYESPGPNMLSPLPQNIRLGEVGSIPSPANSGNSSNGGALTILADASLAAEIDGRSKLTGLDPSFRLSSITSALQSNGSDEAEERAPGLLSKGIVDAETAVELFRM